jgi:hypothetical protein
MIGQRVLQLLADQISPEVASPPATSRPPGAPRFRGWDPIDDPCCLFCSTDQHFRKFRTFGRSIPLRRMCKLPLNVVSTTAGASSPGVIYGIVRTAKEIIYGPPPAA